MSLKNWFTRKLERYCGIRKKVVIADIKLLSPNERLRGKKIVLTGGSTGIGLAMAKKFIAEGAQVLIASRNEERLKKCSQELGCLYLVLDVNEVAVFGTFIEKARELLGGIDSIVLNSGVSLHEGNIKNVTPEQFDQQISTNLKGSYFLAQQFILKTDPNIRRSILFVTSERGEYVDDLPYGLTKIALNSLTKGLAYRFAKSGIRVNAVAPGVTTSDMTGFSEENLYCSYNINKRAYIGPEVAEVATFLLSDESGCLSGQIVTCNEGKSINSHLR